MTSSHDQLVEQLIKCQKLKMLPPPIRVNRLGIPIWDETWGVYIGVEMPKNELLTG